ncbi:hypothetical protein DPMN_005145 [Dreissena polymorpha]|uniref:Uncharacterized protein n=1 Tax=Dreissena polymorpha TaxID=45954 RepID=A0A9D4RWJ6_DREPO|nr:hypothetical protein DPMN_005145 [Dreissena polymorpha]
MIVCDPAHERDEISAPEASCWSWRKKESPERSRVQATPTARTGQADQEAADRGVKVGVADAR